jgi:multiple sugar transport system permease protein
MRHESALARLAGKAARGAIAKAVVYAFLVVGLAIVLLPFAWMLSTSLKSLAATFTTQVEFIPKRPLWSNYSRVWSILPFGTFYLNSLIVAAIVTASQIFLSSLAAYGFARLSWPGRDKAFILYLAAMMIPGQVVLIPNFLAVSSLGGVDRYWGLIVPQVFTVFGTFLLRQSFKTIPASLEEAALMDGASRARIYASVIMPLSKPAIAALGVFSFMFSWNNFLWPLVVTSKERMFTLPIGLLSFQGQYTTDFPLMMAAACQAMLPVLILYAAAQKYFIEGVALTGMANS